VGHRPGRGRGGSATVARPEVLFEDVIAQVTALAVLLPVVAGESGNAGAPALAVTMRELVLREISLRRWPHMVWKEASVGLINGVAVALTTALAVRAGAGLRDWWW
jgi:magnesium transporter